MDSNDDIHGIVIDEIIDTQPLDEEGTRALVMRSGAGMVAIVLTPKLAQEAADMLASAFGMGNGAA